MCAFYRKGGEDDAFKVKTPDQIEKRVAAAKDLGATEVHIVGGFILIYNLIIMNR
ncbi:MAG: hypothetical protein Ct9H300mP17_05800 [Candidatus Nitrosopelagicus sp.]|nr:MAG: hypothetical protein Ct9H300mP17_05800 [Candidatus Nitrosopelagicus sp.]